MARHGFTLTELLVVMAIIGVLSALLMPAISLVKDSAHSVRCSNNLRQLGIAIHLYVAEQEGFVPPARTNGWGLVGWTQYQFNQWQGFLRPYLSRGQNENQNNERLFSETFTCPSRPRPTNPVPDDSDMWNQAKLNSSSFGATWRLPDNQDRPTERVLMDRISRRSLTFAIGERWGLSNDRSTVSVLPYVLPPYFSRPLDKSGAPISPPPGVAPGSQGSESLRVSHRGKHNMLLFDGRVDGFSAFAGIPVPWTGWAARPDHYRAQY